MVCRYSSPNKYRKLVLLIQYQNQFTRFSLLRFQLSETTSISWADPQVLPTCLSRLVMKKVIAQVHRQCHLSCCVDEASYKLLLVSASEAHSSAIVLLIINSPRCWWLVKYHPFLFLLPPLLGQGGQAVSRVLYGYVWAQCIRIPSASFVTG